MILLEIAFWLISQTRRKPLVSSKIPEAIGVIKLLEMPNRWQKGVTIWFSSSKNWHSFKIERITLNSTTKPPITKMVCMAFKILLAKISPKFEKVTEELVVDIIWEWIFSLSWYFQKRKKNPTKIQLNRWVRNSSIPIWVLPNRVIPTVPIINKGPELFVKARSRSASALVHRPSCLNFVTIFAPTG